MAPPSGVGFAGIGAAKLYSPMVWRICARVAIDSRSGCRMSPTSRSNSRRPRWLDDLVHLVAFGDRRKRQHLPGFLLQDVADEVVLVQPLHDDDDAAALACR